MSDTSDIARDIFRIYREHYNCLAKERQVVPLIQDAIDRACQPLQSRLDALKPGTIEAITDGLWKFAEKECGHNPCSAKHALTTVIETVHQLQQRVKELEGRDQQWVEKWQATVDTMMLASERARNAENQLAAKDTEIAQLKAQVAESKALFERVLKRTFWSSGAQQAEAAFQLNRDIEAFLKQPARAQQTTEGEKIS